MASLCSRRHFLHANSLSLGSLGLAWLLKQDRLLASPGAKPELLPATFDLASKQPHHAPRAKAMISIFMVGGPSQVDLFDPSHYAVEDIVHYYDWQATLLHLFGLDHKRLVFKRNNRETSLTDGQDGQVVEKLFA